ncbi:hypothetical protein [Tahibacter caeni]|uniref:hypothetical protein n=1 Tax=Tahibacter caeni TaxID=1453545 RepID=UPI002148FF65|nr:hypothetical protein [Tahibacter caeni]
MSADARTPLDHVAALLAQLKEMRHYAKNNVENFTAQCCCSTASSRSSRRPTASSR